MEVHGVEITRQIRAEHVAGKAPSMLNCAGINDYILIKSDLGQKEGTTMDVG